MKVKQKEKYEKTIISNKIYDKKTIKKIDKKLSLFGLEKNMEAIEFLNLRLVTTCLVFVGCLVLELGYVVTPIVSLIYFVMFYYIVIETKLKKRTFELENEAMHFFEVLILSLETGRNLEESISTTCRNVDGKIADEFMVAIKEMEYGKSLSECLSSMKTNIPSETINNIIISINQSNLFGSSAVTTLYTQIDYLRDKKILEVKAMISKVPTKISIISVLFFVPLILLIILAPVLLEAFQ